MRRRHHHHIHQKIRKKNALMLGTCSTRLSGSVWLVGLGRVQLAVLLDLGFAAAAVLLGDLVHHHGDVQAAAKPGGFVWCRQLTILWQEVK